MSPTRFLKPIRLVLIVVLVLAWVAPALAQTATQSQVKPPDPKQQVKPPDQSKPPDSKTQVKPTSPAQKAGTAPPPAAAPAPPPPDYVIGPDDVLQVLFWRERDHSAEVVVRPDGMISLPLLNDVQAAGLTPDQLRAKVTADARKYFQEDPSVTVIVKQINSRKVFITGQVNKPGPYPLGGPTTVLQLIAMAGGLGDFADQKNIAVMRVENGKPVRYPFNYKDVIKGKNLKQNILLKPGDTVIVP